MGGSARSWEGRAGQVGAGESGDEGEGRPLRRGGEGEEVAKRKHMETPDEGIGSE
jgi:hypothetical protein